MSYHQTQAMSPRWPDINPETSGFTPQLPPLVMTGVDAVGQLPQAARATKESNQAYGDDPCRALWAWTRSAARTLSCCDADFQQQPKAAVSTSASAADLPKVEAEGSSADAADRAAARLQSDMDSRNARRFFPMAQRAMVIRSKVTIRTVGGLEELEESDEDGYDDDAEALVEPLRQSGAQAEVGTTIRRLKPGVMAPYEEQVIGQTLWDPTEVTSQFTMRNIQEVQHLQPWCSMLQPELLNRMAVNADPEVERKHTHSPHYLPSIEDIRRLRAVQCAHTQKVLEVLNPQDAYRLGFHDLSADKAVTEWAAKHGQGTVHHLEGGLAHKVEGLESVRREKLPSSRLYQLSEYYYKVWRTLHTPEAQTHYMNKCKEKRAELAKKEQQRQRLDNRMRGQQQSQPLRQYNSIGSFPPVQQEPAGDATNGNLTHASNAGSHVSSPRYGATGRNVRPRMEQWGGAGGTQMDAGFHSSQLASHMNAGDNHMVHG